MVAYSFKPRFEASILSGAKSGTIRPANPAATAAERLVVLMPMRV